MGNCLRVDDHDFSAWTLFVLLMSGITIMLVTLYLEKLCDLVLQRTPFRKHARLRRCHAEWKAGSTLQLQRIAHENLGFGTLKRTDESVPVTNRGDILGTFNIDDEKHARLVNLGMERKYQGIYGNTPSDETPDEETADSAALGDEIASAGGRVQYHRVASNEHAST